MLLAYDFPLLTSPSPNPAQNEKKVHSKNKQGMYKEMSEASLQTYRVEGRGRPLFQITPLNVKLLTLVTGHSLLCGHFVFKSVISQPKKYSRVGTHI